MMRETRPQPKLKHGPLISAATVLGVLIFTWIWWGSQWSPFRSQDSPVASELTDTSDIPPILSARQSHAPATAPVLAPPPAVEAATNSEPQTAELSWQEELNDVLSAGMDDLDTARRLLEIFPNLPEEGQVEVSQDLSNLVPDDEYSVLGNYLASADTPEPVRDSLFAGLLMRPNAVKLPWLLELARSEDNPKAADARELLKTFTEADYGNDWNQWAASLNDWLRDHPE